MEGFFKKEDTISLKVTGRKSLSCFSCGLYRKGAMTPKMEPYGNFKKKIMIIGEYPSERDDRNGKPWQGKAGRLLERSLEEIGIDLFDDCISLNSVNCLPPDERLPSAREITACRDVKVLKAISEHNPATIILLGNIALSTFLGMKKRSETTKQVSGIAKWSGWTIPDQDFKCWICPTYHPAYIESLETPESKLVWKKDLHRAVATAKKKFPIYQEPIIHYIDDLDWLYDNMKIEEFAAFDYETNALKPHAPGHKILSASICWNKKEVAAFLMPEKKSKRQPFIDFLQSDIPKVAQNFKFEDNWSHVRLKTYVRNWVRDTMLWAHVFDNRKGITGLKFQAYVNFGVFGYDDDVSPYIEKQLPGGFNALPQFIEKTQDGERALLKYNAWDSYLEYLLAQRQLEQLDELSNSL